MDYAGNILVAATLAWLCKSKDCLFDNYYDSYHQGIHFPGGDSRELELGQLTGGMVIGDRHFEEFYFMLLNFDVKIFSLGETIFLSSIKNMNIPVISLSDRFNILYKAVFKHFKMKLSKNIVMIGSNICETLSGLEAYIYPEIYYRQAIGVLDSISEDELSDLYQSGSKIYCLFVNDEVVTRLKKQGYQVDLIDKIEEKDDYSSIIKRIVLRWKENTKGWLLGDPVMVTHWLPKACEEDLISLYSIPQEKILDQAGDLISSKGNVIFGRQYSDKDFFKISELNQCLQVIDPYRPPFQSVKHINYSWKTNQDKEGFYNSEYSDKELRQFAREGRILISLMFWTGMIREISNFYNLIDLIAATQLECGLVLTAQSFEYMMHTPFELLNIPIEKGGVYPLVEPILGSCGIGVGIESSMAIEKLREDLEEALSRIYKKVKIKNYMPRGWWPTMDTYLNKLNWWKRPKRIRFQKYDPYIQFRFYGKENGPKSGNDSYGETISISSKNSYRERIYKYLNNSGLIKYFSPFRPYEFYEPGSINKDVIEVIKSVGLEYMFTKSGFHTHPKTEYIDNDFIAMNHTTGQWDGWTPFETVNDISDLSKSERILQRRKKPGWIVGTIDTCLWAFGGEFWKRSKKLYEIAQFCVDGGKSKKLINVRPYTISRYARIINGIN